MKNHREEFSVERMAKVLKVSRSGYYAWLRHEPTDRDRRTETFDAEVNKEFALRKGRAGRDTLTAYLRVKGILCTRKRVGGSMKRQGLTASRPKRFIATTDSKHPYRIADNLLQRNFTAPRPDAVWVSDITYLPCEDGSWLYLTTFIDLFSRAVVGWNVSGSLKHEYATVPAFKTAALRRGNVRGLVVHSDRGIQYCCDGFQDTMKLYGCTQSMSKKGDPWDNAVAESFFATLKRELVGAYRFRNLDDAKTRLFEYIEIDYNRNRFHSHLGPISPVMFEEAWFRKCA